MYIYKILSAQAWQESQELGLIPPQKLDTNFIHLCKQDQINKIVEKFYNNEPKIIIATIDANKLSGNLIEEANPGGTTKYFHLYDGKLPLDCVVEINQYSK